MPLTTADYRIEVGCSINVGIQVRSTWYYAAVGGAPEAADLAVSFIAIVVPAWKDVVNINLSFDTIRVTNLADPTDFSEGAIGGTGARNDPMPTSFLAWSFIFRRGTGVTRNGYKRLGPITEADLSGNNAISTFLPTLQATALTFESDLTPQSGIYRPMIPHWVKEGTLGSSYVLEGLYDIASVEYQRVTTQNTRKPWIGV